MFRALAGAALTALLLASSTAAAPHDRQLGAGPPHGFSGDRAFRQRSEHGQGMENGGGHRAEINEPHHRFQGVVRDFSPGDRFAWRSGRWRHERHDGRLGWWFVVDGFWFLYPQPIYPYPDFAPYYSEAPYADSVWYRCTDPDGYYPYVRSCNAPWQMVPTVPPPPR